MVFGKIEYLNLLPFHVFMKRFLRYSRLKQSMNYYRGVPSDINAKFKRKKVDAAFISSINSSKCNKPKLGIIAQREVKSVLVLPTNSTEHDSESATSNVLAATLGLSGKILIGDKALRYYLYNDGSKKTLDLAKIWYERYRLPFVFATLCHNRKLPLLKRVEKRFAKSSRHIRIPRYLLERSAKKTGIRPQEIKAYLRLISYEMDTKSRKSLSKFLRKAKLKDSSSKIIG